MPPCISGKHSGADEVFGVAVRVVESAVGIDADVE
jgi:hypothetical protein